MSPVRFLLSLSLYSSAREWFLKDTIYIITIYFTSFQNKKKKNQDFVGTQPLKVPGSAGRYWKSMGSLTSLSEGRRSCILTLTGSLRLVLRYGGVRKTIATCLWTSAWENVPFPSQESWKKRTSMSSAEQRENRKYNQIIKTLRMTFKRKITNINQWTQTRIPSVVLKQNWLWISLQGPSDGSSNCVINNF